MTVVVQVGNVEDITYCRANKRDIKGNNMSPFRGKMCSDSP